MKIFLAPNTGRRGFTWIEVVVVIAVMALGIALILPALTKAKARAKQIRCVSHHKQIGTAFRLYANDYGGHYPYQVFMGAMTNPVPPSAFGLFDTNNPANLWRLFQAAGNEISSALLLVCPSDTRAYASDFNEDSRLTKASFGHPTRRTQALSYFYGLSAREDDPNLLVVGDRNLTDQGTDTTPGTPYLQGVATLGVPGPWTNQPIRWSTGLHDKGGNVGFSDGSVQQLNSGKLREALVNAGHANTTVWLPNP